MLDLITIILKGSPIPWTPSRIRPGKPAYNPKGSFKERHRLECHLQYGHYPIDEAVSVEIRLFFPFPKNATNKFINEVLSNKIRHTKKPDIDNCCKYALDCIKGIVIKDDNQVCELNAIKLYSRDPHSEIKVCYANSSHCLH